MNASDFSRGDRVVVSVQADPHGAPGCDKPCCAARSWEAEVLQVFAKRNKLRLSLEHGGSALFALSSEGGRWSLSRVEVAS